MKTAEKLAAAAALWLVIWGGAAYLVARVIYVDWPGDRKSTVARQCGRIAGVGFVWLIIGAGYVATRGGRGRSDLEARESEGSRVAKR
jgi:predicted membrane channel-forming protein YqfA (hemolysin III family)